MGKSGKYLHYIRVISESPQKGWLLKELLKEVRMRGIVSGIQSFLHQNADYFFPGYDVSSGEEPVLFTGKKQEHLVFSLPIVTTPKVSVIIALGSHIEQVYYSIKAFAQHTDFLNYEVLVVDDGTEKGSTVLSTHIRNLTVLRNDVQLGYVKSLKQAVKHARGDMYLFLGQNARPKKGWMHELLQIFEKYDHVGIVGAKHLNADSTLKEAGGIVYQDGTVWAYGNGDSAEKAEYNFVRDADHVSGTAMMISKEAWDKTGGFDEGYKTSFCEDTDLCFVTRKSGFRVMYQPAAVVTHHSGGRSVRTMDEQTKKQLVADRQRFREKWEQELKARPRKGKRLYQVRGEHMGYRNILVIDQDLPGMDRNPAAKNVNDLVELLLEMKYRVTFLSTYAHQSQQSVEQLQQKGIEVLMGDRQDHVKEYMPYYDAVLMCRIAASIPYVVLLRNNNYKGKIINFGRELSHLKVDRELVVRRDLVFDLQSKLLKAQEDFVYTHADHSLLVSWEEIEYLRTYISKQLHYIPPYHFDVKTNARGFEEREGLLFVAEGNYLPDQDALKWLLKMYETLHRKGIKMTLAVSNAPSFLFDQKKKYNLLNIISDTAPDTVEKLYAQARAVIAPMRIGAGMKGRVVEAMAHGVPVVGTFLAYEGIPRDESFVYVGHNTEQELQMVAEQVCTDKARWQHFSEAGISYARKYFDSASLKATLLNILTVEE